MIAFLPDFTVRSENYLPGQLLDLRLNNNYFNLLAGMLLLALLALGLGYLAIYQLDVFDDPGFFSVSLLLITLLLFFFVYGNLAAAKTPWYAKERITFRPDGIYHNHTKAASEEIHIPIAQLKSLVFEEHRGLFKTYINGAVSPIFEFAVGATMFAAAPITLVTFVQIILGLPNYETLSIGPRTQYRLNFAHEPEAPQAGFTEQPEHLATQPPPQPSVIPLAAPSPAAAKTIAIIQALHFVTALPRPDGWLRIFSNDNTHDDTEFWLHPATGEIVIPRLLFKDKHYAPEHIRRVFSSQKTRWVKYQGQVLIGKLKLQTSTGDPTLLTLSMKVKGDGVHQQFELKRDLGKLEEVLTRTLGESR